jgi:hypothetical protein
MVSARRTGFQVKVEGQDIVIELRKQDLSSRDVIMESSLVVEGCDGYVIADYCYGGECGDSKFQMLLRPPKPKV